MVNLMHQEILKTVPCHGSGIWYRRAYQGEASPTAWRARRRDT